MKKNIKEDTTRRLKIIEGHLRKVTKMVEEDKYCIDILHQSLAVQSALKKVDSLILDQHFKDCVVDAMSKEGAKKEKTIKELLEIYKFSNK